MKNFGTLFGYEMKKIWKRPMTWLAVVLFSAGFVYYSAIPFYHFDFTYSVTLADGTTVSREVTAEEQDRIQLEAPRALSGQMIDETFFQNVRDALSGTVEGMEPGSIEGPGDYFAITGPEAYFYLVDPTYLGAYRLLGAEDSLLHRRDMMEEYLEANWKKYLTDEDIAYWLRMEERIEQPFIYEPTDAPSRMFDVMGTMGIFIPVLVALCVCDLFSQERRARTYPQIFSSRQGRNCLYWAKILAGGISSMLAAGIAIGAVIGASLIRYGLWGWGAAIQLCLYVSSCSFPIKAWQGILILAAMVLVYALLSGMLISVVSMWSGSSVAALAVAAGVVGVQLIVVQMQWMLAAPLELLPSLRNVLLFLPIGFVSCSALIDKGLADFFGLQLNLIQAGILVYLAISAALGVLCWVGWRRSAVGRT